MTFFVNLQDSPADDSDADPHWLPSPAASSPVSQDQIDLSEEVEAMLIEGINQDSDWLDDNITSKLNLVLQNFL